MPLRSQVSDRHPQEPLATRARFLSLATIGRDNKAAFRGIGKIHENGFRLSIAITSRSLIDLGLRLAMATTPGPRVRLKELFWPEKRYGSWFN